MASLLVVLFPLVLLAFMLFMERVENPLRKAAVENRVEEFLDTARPEEVDTLVIAGLSTALADWENRRRRRGITRLLPVRGNKPPRRPASARHRA